MNAKMRDFRPSVSDWFVLDTAFLCSNYLSFCYLLNICSLTSLVITIAVSALSPQMKYFFFPVLLRLQMSALVYKARQNSVNAYSKKNSDVAHYNLFIPPFLLQFLLLVRFCQLVLKLVILRWICSAGAA